MDTCDDDGLFGELAALRPDQNDAFACSLRAAVRQHLTGAATEPFRLGRFTVLEPLGGGGMGVVFVAYDPDLDRKIALKVLRSRGERGQRDVLREGRALARLKHANVVAVYEVGVLDQDVFVAMEYVEGKNLREWLRTPRRTDEILARLIEAGRGLSAAHAVGLVHRDCKPENLVIDAQGHARVVDFGLARLLVDLPQGDEPAADPSATTVSMHGGTPAYMAPERLAGGAEDARCDQFSYCVTCWEALYGARPAEGRPEPVSSRNVPGWVRRVLERGLAADPAARWPSMAALLAELQADPTRRRRTLAGVAALGLVSAGWFGARDYAEGQQVAACEVAGATITEVWDPSVQAKLRAGLLATGVVYAETTAEQVVSAFAAYAGAWQTARTESCLDARVRGVWSEQTLDAAVWCLDERRMQFAALIAAYMQPAAAVMQDAVLAAAELPRVDPCRDAGRLAMLPDLPTDRDGVKAVLGTLSRAGALRASGAYEAGLAVAREAVAAAEALGWPPLTAATRYRSGDLLECSGAFAEAEAELERSYFQAAQVGALEVAAEAAAKLMWTVGVRSARHGDGFRWAKHADVVFAALGAGEDDLRRVNAIANLAIIHEEAGDYPQAEALYRRALAIDERALGPEHPLLAPTLNNLGNLFLLQGNYEQSRVTHERSLALREKALGPEHPDVAQSLSNLANVDDATGRYEQGKPLLTRALAIRERALGPEHPDVATTLNNLANIHDSLGAFAEAKAMHLRALAIREKALGPDHVKVASSLNNLAVLHEVTGSHAEAQAMYERALAIREKALGPDHPNIAVVLTSLANLRATQGAYEEARAMYERALAIDEKALGPGHPQLAHALTGLAKIAIRQGRPVDAVALAERGLQLREAGGVPPEWLARSRFVVARALWDAGAAPERVRALTLARQALDGFRGVQGRDAEIATMQEWLASRAGAP